ncbi:MAG: AraC family transcriptional regulator [Anaerolineaceae bacterium]|nr:AraC family transcriptional regulator [Anaerolineaceae bacterium]
MSNDQRMTAILRAIQLVENQLRSPITVKDMALEAGYSPYYFCTLFSQFTRHSPYDYLIRRRMTEAGKLLLTTDHRIIDLAYEFQFESHEGFTRAFRRIFGSPPNEVKQRQCLPFLSCLPILTEAHLECLLQEKGLISSIKDYAPGLKKNPLSVQTCWPNNTGLQMTGSESLPSLIVVFTHHPSSNTTLCLEWILHTWLFFSHYHLHGSIIYQPSLYKFNLPVVTKE